MSSFLQFSKLPTELQLKIWSHSLETPRNTPRIIKVDLTPDTFEYEYKSQPPPLTKTCRISRQVAIEHYSVLNPSTLKELGAIYFSPTIDILHYNSSYTDESPYRRSTPFLDPKLPIQLVQHMILTQSYITLRAHRSFQCPIPELRCFQNIKTIYIELPSHAELQRDSEDWYRGLMRFSPDVEFSLPTRITDFYAREKLEEAASGCRDIVPGYTLLSKDKKCPREHQVISSFGRQVGGVKNAWIYGDKPERIGSSFAREEDCMYRDLPAVRYLRGYR